jgi:TIR domain
MSEKYTLYLSHGWAPEDADLNTSVWALLADRCNLLIDMPEPVATKPPYYINRIETLLRRSDVFVSILTYQPGAAARAKGRGDERLNCSAACLFEARLAERADLPRLVIYDHRTGFKPPPPFGSHARYFGLNLDEVKDYLPQPHAGLKQTIADWLADVTRLVLPAQWTQADRCCVYLSSGVPRRDEVATHIRDALIGANFRPPVQLPAPADNDIEVLRELRNAGLVVADLSDDNDLAVYAMAHALFIPAVRLLAAGAGEAERALPWILRGHPGGYQHDLVRWTEPADIAEAVAARASAMFEAARALTSYEAGRRVLQSRRYGKHKVFISHDAAPTRRQLVDGIIEDLDGAAINVFEYVRRNVGGEPWLPQLQEALAGTTHFVVLLSDGYEQSAACVAEMDYALEHVDRVRILPYLVEGRERPHVALRDVHHTLLDGQPAVSAAQVAGRVRALLAPS